MILVDTNVISEPLRKSPEPRVVAWLDSQPMETLYLSAVTVAELRFGVASLPAGRRRDALRHDLEQRILPLFAGRVLPFDLLASQSFATVMSRARASGTPIAASDGYIAATAHANGMAVATRDTRPFESADVPTVDPWKA
jgi:predicted nucleic acid-binding protein